MVKNRTIVSITLGYIIGIIWGLYLNISIVLLYIIIFFGYKILGIFKICRKILRYIKINFNQKTIILIILASIISSTITMVLNNKYNNLYKDVTEVTAIAKVVSNKTEKHYKDIYKIKIIELNSSPKYKDTYLNIEVSKSKELKYGSYIEIKGNFKEPETQRNYGGFDYKEYLKTQKIYGTLEKSNVLEIKKENSKEIFVISNKIFLSIKQLIENKFNPEESSIILGILLGYTQNIDEDVKENFSNSNISHILAVSGMHITYIVLLVSIICEKISGKKISKIVTSFVLIAYMLITGFGASVVRAGIMGILRLLSKVMYRKNDTCTSISIAILITLIYNPFLIKSISVVLSYLATIGILLLNKNILKFLSKIKIKKKGHLYRHKYTINKNVLKILKQLYEILSVSFSAQIFIFPIIIIYFHKIGLTFFITNFFVSLIIGPIIIISFIFLISSGLNLQLSLIVKNIFSFFIQTLLKIAEIGAKIPLSKIWVTTPKWWQIILYYLAVILINLLYGLFIKIEKSTFEKRIKNYFYLIKYKSKNKIKKIAVILVIVIVLINIFKVHNLKIYFVDVGQGDCTLIVTPRQKKILIDGGGSTFSDIGKNTLIPYLLNRNISKLDYIIVSHFDTDHVRTGF